MLRKALNIEEAAKFLGVHPNTLRLKVKTKEWPIGRKIGKEYRFLQESLDAFVRGDNMVPQTPERPMEDLCKQGLSGEVMLSGSSKSLGSGIKRSIYEKARERMMKP